MNSFLRRFAHMRTKTSTSTSWIALAVLLFTVAGCRVGPNYHAPTPPSAPSFNGSAPAPAAAQQAIGYSDWWKIFNDPQLNALETEADAANRDIRIAIERVDQARAATGFARSYLFPTVSAQPSAGRFREAQNRPNNGNTSGKAATYNDFQLPLVVNYEIDAWGRVRRTVEAARATAQATDADLRLVRLTTEATVAMDYYQLRETEQELGVLVRTTVDLQ